MSKRWDNRIVTGIVCFLGVLALSPIFFLATKSASGVDGFTLRQYAALFCDGGEYFFLFLRSYLVAVAITAGQTLVSIAAGFLLGRFRFRGRRLLLGLYALILFLPYSAVMLPNYMILRELRLLNTQASIILPAVFSPLGAVILTIFVASIPEETFDAALLETGKLSEILRYVALPQIKPGIALTLVVTFTEAWNMVEQPQAMMEDKLRRPLSVSLNGIFSGGEANFAGAFLYILPPILLLWSLRDSFRSETTKNSSSRKEKRHG